MRVQALDDGLSEQEQLTAAGDLLRIPTMARMYSDLMARSVPI